MPNKRKRPRLVGTWMTVQESALIKAVAEAEQKTVTDLVREILLPEVCERATGAAAAVKSGAAG